MSAPLPHPPARYCEHPCEQEGGKARRCWRPALFLTPQGLACAAHAAGEHSEPLSAEERLGAVLREVEKLRSQLRSFSRRRKGYRYQIQCQDHGRSNAEKRSYQASLHSSDYWRRAKENEAIANLAMSEGLKAVGLGSSFDRVSDFFSNLWRS